MSLSKLPRELILTVADILPTVSLTHLLRTCHSLHQLLGPALTTRITNEQLASTILENGIERHHLPTIHLALAHNASWHTMGENGLCGYTAVEHACELGHTDTLTALITHYGPSILTENHTPGQKFCHTNPLEIAICSQNLTMTTFLLEHGAPANRTVWYGYPSSDKSPLDYAAKHGTAAIAEVLIKHGADVPHASRSLNYALNHGRWDVVRLLLREGVWLSRYGWCHSFPLTGRSPEEIDAWVESGIEYIRKHGELR